MDIKEEEGEDEFTPVCMHDFCSRIENNDLS